MHQKSFGGRALPGPTGGAYSVPQARPSSWIMGVGPPGRGGEEGWGKGEEVKGKRSGKERKGKVLVSVKIKSWNTFEKVNEVVER